jgi:hypothetical protein
MLEFVFTEDEADDAEDEKRHEGGDKSHQRPSGLGLAPVEEGHVGNGEEDCPGSTNENSYIGDDVRHLFP